MILSLVQFAPERLGRRRNLDRMESLAPARTDLVLFPELCTSGYLFADRAELMGAAEPLDGESVTRMTAWAKARRAAVAFGLPERKGDRVYNSAVLVGPEGLIGVYRKVHLFDRETVYFDPGEEGFSLFEWNGARIGIMICFDWVFPESARTLALLGAEILLHPSNLVLPYAQDAMITRSLENRLFTATCNRTGEDRLGEESIRYTGRSQIVSPKGVRLAEAGAETEEAISVEIDPAQARDKRFTRRNDLFLQRRPEFYRRMAEPGGAACANASDERPYRPNVAAIVIDAESRRVLVGERRDAPGMWQLPQGGIDDGETPEEAVRRELREETGLSEVEILARSPRPYRYDFPPTITHPITRSWRGQEQIYFLLRASAGAGTEPELSPDHPEFVSLAWMTPEELISQIIPFKREVYDCAFRDLWDQRPRRT